MNVNGVPLTAVPEGAAGGGAHLPTELGAAGKEADGCRPVYRSIGRGAVMCMHDTWEGGAAWRGVG